VVSCLVLTAGAVVMIDAAAAAFVAGKMKMGNVIERRSASTSCTFWDTRSGSTCTIRRTIYVDQDGRLVNLTGSLPHETAEIEAMVGFK